MFQCYKAITNNTACLKKSDELKFGYLKLALQYHGISNAITIHHHPTTPVIFDLAAMRTKLNQKCKSFRYYVATVTIMSIMCESKYTKTFLF